MISMDKTYRTRDGREVRLLCVDAPNEYRQVVAILGLSVFSPHADGKFHDDVMESSHDLIEVVPDVVRWVNVYSTAAMAIVYQEREDAELHSGPNRLAILKITTKNGGVNGAEDVSVEVLPVGAP